MRPAPVVVVLSLTAAVMAASAAYHVALALGLSAYSARGDPPSGNGLVLAGLVAVWLAAGVLVGAAAWGARVGGWPVIAGLTALAVTMAVARYYSPDAYYLNTNDRIADHYPGGRIAALVVLAAVATTIARIRPRVGAPVAAAVMVLCAATLADEGYGN
jgi:hypothetical protein